MTESGQSAAEIAKQLHISKSSVQRYRRKLKLGEPQRKPRLKTVVNTNNQRKVKNLIRGKRNMSIRNATKQLNAKGIQMSTMSVWKCAKMAGLKKKKYPRKIRLNDDQKEKRVAYAIAHQDDDWSRYIFIDESRVELTSLPNSRNDGVWLGKEEQAEPWIKDKHPTSLNVLAGICKGGRTKLHLYEGTMNSTKYQGFLKQIIKEANSSLFPDSEWTLVQDSAPYHTTNAVYQLFKKKKVKVIHRDQWPAQSPDLNPIEHVWSVLKDHIKKKPPHTKEELKKIAKKEWSKISQDIIDNCVIGLTSRLKSVIEAEGDQVK